MQLANQAKEKFPAKSCGARAIFLKLFWRRGCLCESGFLVTFAHLNKQLFNVKSLFKFLDYIIIYYIYIHTVYYIYTVIYIYLVCKKYIYIYIYIYIYKTSKL